MSMFAPLIGLNSIAKKTSNEVIAMIKLKQWPGLTFGLLMGECHPFGNLLGIFFVLGTTPLGGVLPLCDDRRMPASSLWYVRHKVRQSYISRTV